MTHWCSRKDPNNTYFFCRIVDKHEDDYLVLYPHRFQYDQGPYMVSVGFFHRFYKRKVKLHPCAADIARSKPFTLLDIHGTIL